MLIPNYVDIKFSVAAITQLIQTHGIKLGMVVYSSNPSTWKVEANGQGLVVLFSGRVFAWHMRP
jgi:hypothetical protein